MKIEDHTEGGSTNLPDFKVNEISYIVIQKDGEGVLK